MIELTQFFVEAGELIDKLGYNQYTAIVLVFDHHTGQLHATALGPAKNMISITDVIVKAPSYIEFKAAIGIKND